MVQSWGELGMRSPALALGVFSVCGCDSLLPRPQDSRSEHERQYLFSQGHGLAENTELIKSPR